MKSSLTTISWSSTKLVRKIKRSWKAWEPSQSSLQKTTPNVDETLQSTDWPPPLRTHYYYRGSCNWMPIIKLLAFGPAFISEHRHVIDFTSSSFCGLWSTDGSGRGYSSPIKEPRGEEFQGLWSYAVIRSYVRWIERTTRRNAEKGLERFPVRRQKIRKFIVK